MKRCVIFIAILATWMFICAQGAMAVGIDISATVEPNWDNSWDKDALTGIALYTIKVLPGSTYGADAFDVTFEGDIFDTAELEMELLSPSGWLSGSFVPDGYVGDNAYYYVDSPTAWHDDCTDPIQVNPGESVSFLMNYTLLSEDQYDQVSGSGWAWDNGLAWAQAVTATDTNTLIAISSGRGGGTIYISPIGGTVTMQHTPEPATMLLLGSGLIGVGWFGRKKTKKGSKV